MVKYTRAEVAEWQTRRTQNPVRLTPREGSTPSLGTRFTRALGRGRPLWTDYGQRLPPSALTFVRAFGMGRPQVGNYNCTKKARTKMPKFANDATRQYSHQALSTKA